jgi:hypothetical protein
MLIATLMALMLYFGGGSDGNGIFGRFMMHDVEAPMKEVIGDEKRREQALASLAQIQKDITTFNRTLQTDHTTMKALLKNYHSTPEQFTRMSDAIIEKSEKKVGVLWQERAKMLESIKPGEWKAIVTKAEAAQKTRSN